MYCDPRFSGVREVFQRHFTDGLEVGAAFAVYLDGELVVDLWDGLADRHTGRRWERDTPVFAYSCTKAITATVLLRLAERDLVDLTAPAARVWPEFAAGGKEAVTVEHLLTHQAGLPALEEPVPVEEFEDHAAIAARLARQTPIWEPGTAHGYHALTYGFLVGEVVRRVSGSSVGELTAAEIAGPHGLELWLGAPDEVIARAARLSMPGRRAGTVKAVPEPPAGSDVFTRMAAAAADPGSLMNRALGNPGMRLLEGGANHPVILRAGWPAAGVVTTARGLAGFYRALIGGGLLGRETLRDAVRPRVSGPDRVLVVDSAFGLGYMVPATTFPSPSPSAFGHSGLGGSLGLADPAHGLALGYVMNNMADAVSGGLRAYHLTQAVYDAL